MDGLGVEKAILTTDPHDPQPHVMSFAEKKPDRFFLGAHVDPRRGMKAVRALESFEGPYVVLPGSRSARSAAQPRRLLPVYAVHRARPPSRSTPASRAAAPTSASTDAPDKVCLHFPS
jgi:hypothetical protein